MHFRQIFNIEVQISGKILQHPPPPPPPPPPQLQMLRYVPAVYTSSSRPYFRLYKWSYCLPGHYTHVADDTRDSQSEPFYESGAACT
jgi:hypothetical protein